jgi:hypothetical protein
MAKSSSIAVTFIIKGWIFSVNYVKTPNGVCSFSTSNPEFFIITGCTWRSVYLLSIRGLHGGSKK